MLEYSLYIQLLGYMDDNRRELVFLDKINFSSVSFLFKRRLSGEIILFDKPSFVQNFFLYLIRFIGYNIYEAIFFTGHLKTKNGESAYLASTDDARRIAVQAAFEILETSPHLQEINNHFGKNTLHLHLTKQLVWYIKYWTERLAVAKILAEGNGYKVCLKSPDLINEEIVKKAFPETEILFYSPSLLAVLARLRKSKTLYLEFIRFMIFPFNGKKTSTQATQNFTKPSVLLLQEDTIRIDTTLRGQPHWIDFESEEKQYNTYVITSTKAISDLDTETQAELLKNQIFIFDPAAFKDAFAEMRKHKSLNDIRDRKLKLLKSLIFSTRFRDKYFALRTALFLKQAEFVGAVSLWLNIRVFLFRESYIPLTDAIQIVSRQLNVKTIAYQYSNLGTYSPVMMNTADLMLIFSNHFKKVFSDRFFSPSSFIEIGYLYHLTPTMIRERALRLREALLSKGVAFIICFFDENVQYNKWGLVNKSDHLHELHILARLVLNDPTIGVVIKSQFQKNKPSRLYPKDELISNAVNSGRFLELHAGLIRNDIFPIEAALISDIAIGHKFGATASLEVALEGVRSVMLDKYGTRTIWDEFYDRPSITFSTMESLIEAIQQLRDNNQKFNELGDWSSFIHLLSTKSDINPVKRLREVVERECFV